MIPSTPHDNATVADGSSAGQDMPSPAPMAARGKLARLGASVPLVVAPMAGGPSGPALVTAAAQAGATGFLAGGYKTRDALAEEIAATRRSTHHFGVNLFAHTPVPVVPAQYEAYAGALSDLASTYGVELATLDPREDDDEWETKIDLLVDAAVPLVSFTFGFPPQSAVDALRAVGTLVIQTITNLTEAADAAREVGPDILVVQSHKAGGHSGTRDPLQLPPDISLPELVHEVREITNIPLWGAGGIATHGAVCAVLDAGAEAAVVGTVLLRSPESGASATYKAALGDATRIDTVMTRAFSGRPARALTNQFVERFHDIAPVGYPALHHLTSPIRKAAAAAGDPEAINIWAGTGHAHATEEPVAVILRRLNGGRNHNRQETKPRP